MSDLRYNFPRKPLANPEAIVKGNTYRFTVLTDGLIRYEWAEDGQFEDRASTFAINRQLPVPEFKVYDSDDTLEIVTNRFHLTYDKKRFTPSGFLVVVHGKITQWGSQWRYGLPDRANLGGTARTLDEADGRIPLETGVLSRHGFSAIDDSKSMVFEEDGWVGIRKPGDRVDGYLFTYGTDYKESMKAFYTVSGSQPMIPRWALGNWWSRYHAYNADEYVELMDKFKSSEIPFSVAVLDMDWHYVLEERVTSAGWTGYSWDHRLFPDPKGFCDEMHRRNLKVTLNDHPADGVHAFENIYEEMAKALGHDTSHKKPILFDPTNRKFFDAFFDILHRDLENDGVDFWWIDWQQGEFSRIPGLDPLWLLNHFHFLDNARDGKRPIIFSRYGGPGSHRYPVGFSGDSVISWASLDFQPEFTATASNIGYGWWSHDIGGHFFGSKDDELCTRWLQFGVFSPIMRLHSGNSDWMSKEPWQYRRECEVIMSDFLRFRHRMIPYLYSMNVRSATEDEPIIQPLYWEHPRVGETYEYKNQYFFGTELMVAPITSPRSSETTMASVSAWLPPGHRHVDIFTGTVYDGNRELVLYRPLHQFPVLAHEGSIIPLDAALTAPNGGPNPEGFELLVVVGKDGSFDIVEDIGDDSPEAHQSPDKNKQRHTLISYKQASGQLTIGPAKSEAGAADTKRSWKIKFLSYTPEKPESVHVTSSGDTSLQPEFSTESFPATPGLVVTLPPVSSENEITIDLGEDPQLDVLDIRAPVHRIVNDYQCVFGKKDRMWAAIKEEGLPLSLRVSRLRAIGMNEKFLGPICELLLADSRLT
ncbi:hypothetical protein H2201_005081 [Coniosporium apollinis]|uniref:alpha-glucosidase n=1 Tax=Coniosporium apollinis TaxID=61459 RepID=A0ABQ9NR31_9PEZI|nr:hypothetical protein H2201_005081 [Coniosporium apollinis]